jgi:uncharacterized cupredoxin-like copper-binding protein
MRVAATIAAAIALASGLGGCGRDYDTASQPTTTAAPDRTPRVAARVGDYSIRLDRESAPHGNVSFDIRNDGRVEHEFVILRSDRAASALPRTGDAVAEDAAGSRKDEVEAIAPGRTVTLKAKLEPGRYVLICNLAGHYARGMRAPFRVT